MSATTPRGEGEWRAAFHVARARQSLAMDDIRWAIEMIFAQRLAGSFAGFNRAVQWANMWSRAESGWEVHW